MQRDRSDVRLEWATPEVRQDVAGLEVELRALVIAWLERARRTADVTEACADRPGQPLEGCRKLRFDVGDEPLVASGARRSGHPRWRVVVEYLDHHDGSARLLVWAVGRGHPSERERVPDVYTLAGRRRTRRLASDDGYRREVGRG